MPHKLFVSLLVGSHLCLLACSSGSGGESPDQPDVPKGPDFSNPSLDGGVPQLEPPPATEDASMPMPMPDSAVMGVNEIDTDNDGLSDEDEEEYGTDPNNPDSDGDGLGDGDEVARGSDPNKPRQRRRRLHRRRRGVPGH